MGEHKASMGAERERKTARSPAAELELYRPDLVRRAAYLTRGDMQRARDLVQDTYERAVRSFDRLVPGSNVRAWLYTIMARRYRDVIDYDQKRSALDVDTIQAAAPEPEAPPWWASITVEQLRAAVTRIEPELAAVFERREFQRQSYQQMADELGIPVSTVGTRLRRARLELRSLLSAELEKGSEE